MLCADAMILIDYIRNSRYQLNEWEAKFIRDMMFHRPTRLTDKQAVALQGIYAKATGGSNYQKKEYIRPR